MAKRGKDREATSGPVTDEEKGIVKWFLDKKWNRAKEHDTWDDYLYCMGWLYFNSMVISGISPIKKAFQSLEIIKRKDPETFQNYLNTCMGAHDEEMEKLESRDNLVNFPTTRGNK